VKFSLPLRHYALNLLLDFRTLAFFFTLRVVRYFRVREAMLLTIAELQQVHELLTFRLLGFLNPFLLFFRLLHWSALPLEVSSIQEYVLVVIALAVRL
jgi:hypothetical protein